MIIVRDYGRNTRFKQLSVKQEGNRNNILKLQSKSALGFSKLPREDVPKFMRKQRKVRSGRGDKRMRSDYNQNHTICKKQLGRS